VVLTQVASGADAFVGKLAAQIASYDALDSDVSTREAVALHTLDSVAAIYAGSLTSEYAFTARALHRLAPNGGPAALAGQLCVACRLTECDDIDIASCTTPGSVVLPAAITASMLAAGDADAFAGAVVAGYEVMTALGSAADGAAIVYGTRWPTHFGAAMTAAATVAKYLDLTELQILDALAIAASMTTDSAGRIAAHPTSRWLTLACAVQAGIAAAIGAAEGLRGDPAIFSACLGLNTDRLPTNLPNGDLAVERVGFKPYHTSRQGLAATEAFAAIVNDEALESRTIERIDVFVPAPYRAMIDRTTQPRSKTESRGIQYQLALAMLHHDELFDIERATLRTEESDVRHVMEAVTVTASESLTSLYPRVWPAAVRVRTTGATYEREILHPRGDAENPLGRSDIEAKWSRIFRSVDATITIDTIGSFLQADDIAGLFSARFDAFATLKPVH
jgi:2-methylcitrate dehydratase PrpD